jgi:hypothetical protein
VKKEKEEDGWRIRRKKLGRKANFSPTLSSISSYLMHGIHAYF